MPGCVDGCGHRPETYGSRGWRFESLRACPWNRRESEDSRTFCPVTGTSQSDLEEAIRDAQAFAADGRFTNVIHINRSPDEVYAYLSDLEHTPEWNWAITETRKTTRGPIPVGTRYRQTRSVPQSATETLEITALEPNRRIEIEGTLAQFPAQLSYQIVEKEAGTELTNTVNLESQGALRLVAPVLSGRIERAVGDNLNELKTRLETGNDPLRVPSS